MAIDHGQAPHPGNYSDSRREDRRESFDSEQGRKRKNRVIATIAAVATMLTAGGVYWALRGGNNASLAPRTPATASPNPGETAAPSVGPSTEVSPTDVATNPAGEVIYDKLVTDIELSNETFDTLNSIDVDEGELQSLALQFPELTMALAETTEPTITAPNLEKALVRMRTSMDYGALPVVISDESLADPTGQAIAQNLARFENLVALAASQVPEADEIDLTTIEAFMLDPANSDINPHSNQTAHARVFTVAPREVASENGTQDVTVMSVVATWEDGSTELQSFVVVPGKALDATQPHIVFRAGKRTLTGVQVDSTGELVPAV